MSDKVWKRIEPDSPCKSICIIHQQEAICIGCYRTADEVSNWSNYSAGQRRSILAGLAMRGLRLKKRRGGRKRVRR